MLILKNRKAFHEGALVEKFKAGISLRGYEVKAVREGRANFEGAYVQLISGEVMLVNMYIGRYSKQSQNISDDEQRRTRRLLLNESEIEKMRRIMQERGKMCLPLALLLEHNIIKVEIGIMKGLKEREKKSVAKEKQQQKDLEIATKNIKRELDF